MKDYSKLTKPQLIDILKNIEHHLDGCVEYANQCGEEAAKTDKYSNKYACVSGVLQARIGFALSELGIEKALTAANGQS